MFGGLSICSLEVVVGKDGKEHIIEVNDCALTLLGERQRDDMEIIAELVIKEMEVTIEDEIAIKIWHFWQLKCKVPENKVTSADLQDDTSEGVGRNICRTDSHGK